MHISRSKAKLQSEYEVIISLPYIAKLALLRSCAVLLDPSLYMVKKTLFNLVIFLFNKVHSDEEWLILPVRECWCWNSSQTCCFPKNHNNGWGWVIMKICAWVKCGGGKKTHDYIEQNTTTRYIRLHIDNHDIKPVFH